MIGCPQTVLPNVLCIEEELLALSASWEIPLSKCSADCTGADIRELLSLEIRSITSLFTTGFAYSKAAMVIQQLPWTARFGFTIIILICAFVFVVVLASG